MTHPHRSPIAADTSAGDHPPPVWLVTGCSTGFGRELARAVLERGYRAVVTARDPGSVQEFASAYGDRALVRRLDVTDAAQVDSAVRDADEAFGGIDVLVNNAGIGYFGAVEESDEAEVRRMFEINVWGLSAVTRAALPGMRRRRRGHIVNIASIGGLRAFPGVGYYNATKFAVVGLSEALAQEVAPLGIRVTIVEPSGFRTDWAGRSAGEAAVHIPDYDATAGRNRATIRAASGRQPGDPARAAAAIVAAVEAPEPPLHLLLGRAALNGARKKLEELRRDFDAWEATSAGADFPPRG
jgi:NAD(P)-dependent dehydrogenase (short-subunit alcohol dehydrogenase family)